MSLETLLEAAKFLEHKTEEKETKNVCSKVVDRNDSSFPERNPLLNVDSKPSAVAVCSHDGKSQSNVNLYLPTSDQALRLHSAGRIAKDVNNNRGLASLKSHPAEDGAVALNAAHAMSVLDRKNDSSTIQNKAILKPCKPQPSVGSQTERYEETKTSIMDPMLAARARAAVKSATFDQKEGVLITPPRNIPAALTGQHGFMLDHVAYPSNGSLGLTFKPSYYPINTPMATGGQMTIVNNPAKLGEPPVDKTVSILPSLKTSLDSKTYAALQIKQVKRNVTLTHNQLEKNRRAHLKECFEALKSTIPRLGMRRSSNLTILTAALKQIQMLKRKTASHQPILKRLAKELDDRRVREAVLMKELLQFADRDKIEKVVSETIKNGNDYSPPFFLYDTSQLSTSTASEAEEEVYGSAHLGYNDILFRPVSAHSSSASTQSSQVAHSNHDSVPCDSLSAVTQQSSGARLVSTPSCESLGELQIVEPPLDDIEVVKNASPHPSSEAQRSQNATRAPTSYRTSSEFSSASGKTSPVPKASPIRYHPQPTRRSATPTPSSDFVQFFPRFSVGSGGSPPLMSSPNFEFSSEPVKNEKTDPDAGYSFNTFTYRKLPPEALSSDSNLQGKVSSEAKRSMQPLPGKQSHEARDRSSIQLPAASTSAEHVAADTVIVTSFSGYEVKVKYLNTIAPVASKAYQARIPMKKRALNVDSFTSGGDANLAPSNSAAVARTTSELKMTSLYVGASASVLGASGKSEKATKSESDHESDRESPFVDHKRAKFPSHWRKSLAKAAEKPAKVKMFQVHPYEISEAKTTTGSNPGKSQGGETKRKATFNLWDRKHHAITPTSSRNWRGKQQLLTSKPKTNSSSSIAHAQSTAAIARPPIGSTASTMVSYSLLQNASKPTVSSSLIVNQASSSQVVSASPLEGSNLSSTVSSKQLMKTTSLLSNQQPPSSSFPIHNLQSPYPSTPLAYQVVSSTARSKSPSIEASAPDVNNALTPSSNVKVTSSVVAKETTNTSKHAELLQQPAFITPQPSPLQIPQLPYVFPVSYVMYPPGVGTNGLQFATLPQSAKVLTPDSLGAMQFGVTDQNSARTPSKRPSSPLKPPSRNQSNGSASSTTLSADSTDFETNKSGQSLPKKPRLSERPLSTPSQSNLGLLSTQQAARLAQPQFFLPGNPGGLMVAAPTSNGFNLPLNLFSYPIQAYSGAAGQGYLQALSLNAGQGMSPVWPINQAGLLPAADSNSALVAMSRANLHASPVLRNSKVD